MTYYIQSFIHGLQNTINTGEIFLRDFLVILEFAAGLLKNHEYMFPRCHMRSGVFDNNNNKYLYSVLDNRPSIFSRFFNTIVC